MERGLVNAYPDDAIGTCIAFAAIGTAYLLVDQAMAPDACARLLRSRTATPSVRIFEGCYAGEDVNAVSPLLLAVPGEPAERENCIRRWLRVTDGLPMLSVIKSEQPLSAVNRHLQAQLEADDPDGTAYVLRWADIRSLTLLRAVLTDAQRARLMSGMRAWGWFGRDGTWTVMDAPITSEAHTDATAEPYHLDAAQMDRIRAASMADSLLRYLCGTRQHVRVLATPARVHACIGVVLERLRGETGALPSVGECCRSAVAQLLSEGLVETGGA